MIVGSAEIQIRADTSQFAGQLKNSVREAGAQAEKSLGRDVQTAAAKGARGAEREFKEAGNGIRTAMAGAAAAFVTQRVVRGLVDATKSASDLNEAVNVTGLVFKEGRAEMEAFAKDSVNALGLSETAARQLTASLGGLLKNQGLNAKATVEWSKRLAVLGADMGSAFNVEPAEAIQAIGSALRGEQEPIRRFNVTIDAATVAQKAVAMGLASSTSEVTKQAKTMATLQLIMEQTADVQGDFANTSDGAANSMRKAQAAAENAKASLGQALIPVMTTAAKTVQGLAEGFQALPPAWQSAFAFGGLALAAAVPIGFAIGQVGKLKVALEGAGAAGRIASAGIKGIGVAGLVVGAVTALQHASEKLGEALERAGRGSPKIADLTEQLLKLARTGSAVDLEEALSMGRVDLDTLNRQIDKLHRNRRNEGGFPFGFGEVAQPLSAVRHQLEDIDLALSGLAETSPDYVADVMAGIAARFGVSVATVEKGLDATTAALQRGRIAAGAVELAGKDGAEGIGALGDAAGDAVTPLDRLKGAVDRVKSAIDEALLPTLDAADASDRVADSIDKVRELAEGDIGAIRGVRDAARGVEKANRDVAAAQEALAKAIRERGAGSEEARAAEERLAGAREGLASATERYNDAQRTANEADPRTAANQRELAGAVRDAQRAIFDEVQALVRVGEVAPGAVPGELIRRLENLRSIVGPSLRGEIDATIARLRNMEVPQTLLELLEMFKTSRRGTFGFGFPGPPIQEQPDSYREPFRQPRTRTRPRARQHGGPVGPGEVYQVGEAGPELAIFPRAGQVIPADVSAKLLDALSKSQGGPQHTLHISGTFPFSPEELARQVLRERDWSLR